MMMKSLNADPKSICLYYSVIMRNTTTMLTVQRKRKKLRVSC